MSLLDPKSFLMLSLVSKKENKETRQLVKKILNLTDSLEKEVASVGKTIEELVKKMILH